jgi:hypothetical protein
MIRIWVEETSPQKETKMLNFHSYSLYVGITSRRSRIIILLVATLLVVGLSFADLTISKASTYTGNRNSVVQVSDLKPFTNTVGDSRQVIQPGHDFGAINGAIDPGVRLLADLPLFTYWFNGQMVVRRSELGPLINPVDAFISPRWPGHDFGAIYSTIDPARSLSVSQLEFTSRYTRRR